MQERALEIRDKEMREYREELKQKYNSIIFKSKKTFIDHMNRHLRDLVDSSAYCESPYQRELHQNEEESRLKNNLSLNDQEKIHPMESA